MKGGDQKQFRCTHPGCDKVFNRRDYLERHATNHLPVKPYVCIQCDRHFSRKDLFDNHLSTKRHARVAHEVEHNGGVSAHLGDSSSYTVEELEDSRIGNYEQANPPPLPSGGIQGLGAMSPGVTPGGSALSDQNRTYFVYSLDQLAPQMRAPGGSLAWDDQSCLEQHQQNLAYQRQQLHQHHKSQPLLQKDHRNHSDDHLRTFDHRSSDTNMVGPRDMLESARSVDSTDSLTGLMNWTPSPSVSQRRSSSASGVMRPSLTSPPSALRSPTTDSPEETSVTAVVEHLLDKSASETPSGAFAQLREPITQSSTNKSSSPGATDFTTDNGRQASEISRVDSDTRYSWFFDDSFDTEKSKYGYDLCYSEFVDACATRAAKYGSIVDPDESDFDRMNRNSVSNSSTSERSLTSTSPSGSESAPAYAVPPSPSGVSAKLPRPSVSGIRGKMSTTNVGVNLCLHPARAAMLLTVLQDYPPNLHDDLLVYRCLQAAWKQADDISSIVHRPTFDANTTGNALLSVLLAIGLSFIGHSDAARRIYPSVFLLAFKELREIPLGRTTRPDQTTLETLQAFCLLLRYERLILGPEAEQLTFIKGDAGRHAVDRFLWVALSSVPHTNVFRSPFSHSHVQHQPIWSTSCNEAFLFHQGAEPEAQWREWALLEAAKRTVHLAVYYDSTQAFIGSGKSLVSLFNLDIRMISPDQLWNAYSAQHFFYIAGPSGAVTTVPYLGLIKALIRFPRVAQRPDEQESDPELAPWSMFALQVVAHGLLGIVGRLSGLYAHEEEMLEAVVRVRDSPNTLCRFDNRVQARLYRGLDVWLQNFNAAHGPVGQEPFSPVGGAPLPEYAMLMILCHYASFIYVHEDVAIVRQVTVNMKTWFETRGSVKSLQMLLDYLYMPLYIKWIKTEEAKSIVSTSAVYLAWVHAVNSQVPGGANYLFLSAMIYISTIAVWLYDFAANDSAEYPAASSNAQEKDTLRLENYQFMDDAITYLSEVNANTTNKGPLPTRRSVHSVMLLSACMLYRRRSTNPLVEMLIETLSVMELGHSTEELIEVVKGSEEVYRNRLSRTIELKDCPSSSMGKSMGKSEVAPTSETDGDSDTHMSDIEVGNQFLSPTFGHPMIA